MTEDWVSITDDLPMHDRRYNNLSVDVEAITDTGETCTAFYNNVTREWYSVGRSTVRKIKADVIAWRSL